MDELKQIPIWQGALIVLILLSQSTWLFIDARKRGSYPWFWGMWGLIQFPGPLIFYWLFVRKRWLRKGK
ncbi:sigmaY antisigma factor component [Paenibacillus abyssi]|uniref:SigmaY antisigma factor component n=1 Tax=Paenibacillus abyssi TaxID=1340531 RepID=A0A917D2L4_9BACL|nr:sigmaY antisigma factor component [Paenibacillus abyssi]GGG09228.1 hypothetical protein GCM10010916_27610 [Paenibacillus abyssi]